MSWFTAIMLYVIIWWVTLFMVLPWGVRPPDNPETGHAESAPSSPRIGRKMAINTALATVVWAIIFALVEADIFSFREMAKGIW